VYEIKNDKTAPQGYHDKRNRVVVVQPGQTATIDIHDEDAARYLRRGHQFKKIGDKPDPRPEIDPNNTLLQKGAGTPGGIPSIPALQPSNIEAASRSAGLLMDEALRGELGPVAAQRAAVLAGAQHSAADNVDDADAETDADTDGDGEKSPEQKLVDRYESDKITYSEFIKEAKVLVGEDRWPAGTPKKSEVYELLGVEKKD